MVSCFFKKLQIDAALGLVGLWDRPVCDRAISQSQSMPSRTGNSLENRVKSAYVASLQRNATGDYRAYIAAVYEELFMESCL